MSGRSCMLVNVQIPMFELAQPSTQMKKCVTWGQRESVYTSVSRPGIEQCNVNTKITASHNNNNLHHIFTHQSQTKNSYESLTLTFMVLWFFLVFLRNCFRLPDDMYSVMNTTCEGYKKKSYFDIMATSGLYQTKNNSFRKKMGLIWKHILPYYSI